MLLEPCRDDRGNADLVAPRDEENPAGADELSGEIEDDAALRPLGVHVRRIASPRP